MFGLLLIIWLLYLVPAAVLSAPLWFFGRKRVQWTVLDFAALVLPLLPWLVLIVAGPQPKSLANLIEVGWLGALAPLVPILRLLVKNQVPGRRVAAYGMLIVSLIGVIIYFQTPGLPE